MIAVPLREASMDRKLLPEPGIYRHFKGGQYELLVVAHHSETAELLAIYRAVDDPSKIWVRPLEMFTETIECPEGRFLRFEPHSMGRPRKPWSALHSSSRFTWKLGRHVWDASRTRVRNELAARPRARVG
jgi:hypothetical protein